MNITIYEKLLFFINLTIFTTSLCVGLIITFGTSGGINEGAIPLTVAGCILMLNIIMYIFYKFIVWCDS
jgi:hypothetical protein